MATHYKRGLGFGLPKGLLLPSDVVQPKKVSQTSLLQRPDSQTTPTNSPNPHEVTFHVFVARTGRIVRLNGPDSLTQDQLTMAEQKLKGRMTLVPDTPAKPYQAETPKKNDPSPADEVVKASASSSVSRPFSVANKQNSSLISVSDLEEEWDDKLSIAATETTDREHDNLETLLRSDSMPLLQTGYHIKSADLGLPRHVFPGETIIGTVCAVMDPEVLFVYEGSNEQTRELNLVLKNELSDPRIEELQRYREPPPLDTIVLARFSVDYKWYRAAVVDVDKSGKSVYVFFVDWGNHESVPLEELRPLPQSLARFPQAIFMVCVQGLVAPSEGYSSTKILAAQDILVLKKCEILVKEVQEEGVVGDVFVLDEKAGTKKAVVEIYEERSIATASRKRMIGTPPKKVPMKYTMIPRVLIK